MNVIYHTSEKRVRYGETDQMGYLYYGHYALYYEIGRVELLRSLGLSYKSLESEYGVIMPVTAMQVRYVRPALYDEVLSIRTELRKPPAEDIVFYYELYNSASELVNGATVRLCFVTRETGLRTVAPAVLTTLLAPHFG